MKWILLSAVALVFPMHAMSKVSDNLPSAPEGTAYDYDADLFKKNDEIYAAHAEFLYWAISEGALDYALKMRHNAWGPDQCYAQGRFENATYDVDPGFRVGLHYFRAPNYWEMRWQYTRMTSKGHNSVEKAAADQKFLTGTWPQILTAPLARATSRIHLNYNVFDMMVDRVFFPNPHLRLRVMGGVLAAWMDQDWKIRYNDATPNSTTIRNRWHFVGAGLKTGTMVDWFWAHDIYMTALSTVGILIGSYSNHARQTVTISPGAGYNPAIPLRDGDYHDTRPAVTAQMLLGPSWQKNYPHNRIEVFAGFEANIWFNLQEIYRSTSSTPTQAKETWINTGMLALYGLTTRLTIDF